MLLSVGRPEHKYRQQAFVLTKTLGLSHASGDGFISPRGYP